MPQLNDLRLQRGRLLERITTQRYVLIAEVRPVQVALGRVDTARAGLRRAGDYVRQNPGTVGLLTAVLFAFNIRRALRLARRGFIIWRTWRMLRRQLSPLGSWRGFW